MWWEVRGMNRRIVRAEIRAGHRQPADRRRQRHVARIEDRRLLALQHDRQAEQRLVQCPHRTVEVAEARVGYASRANRQRGSCAWRQSLGRLYGQYAQAMLERRVRAVEPNRLHPHGRVEAEAQLGCFAFPLYPEVEVDRDRQLPPGIDPHLSRYALEVQPRRLLNRSVGLGPGKAFRAFAMHMHEQPGETGATRQHEGGSPRDIGQA